MQLLQEREGKRRVRKKGQGKEERDIDREMRKYGDGSILFATIRMLNLGWSAAGRPLISSSDSYLGKDNLDEIGTR